jgi:putative FmdB family regulatory protein
LPLYEYRCTSCGKSFEKIQKINDAPETACPQCGGALIRPLTAPALQFKGAGWYVNDYASKPSGGSNSDSSAAKSGSESSASASDSKLASESKSTSDSKPAATESKPSSSGSGSSSAS